MVTHREVRGLGIGEGGHTHTHTTHLFYKVYKLLIYLESVHINQFQDSKNLIAQVDIYSYLRGDLRKAVLTYGYFQKNYGKQTTKEMDTWLDAIRNLRNVCAHHNKLVGRTSSVVLMDSADDPSILASQTDLFSRMYALKKILSPDDSKQFKKELKNVIKKAKFNIYQFSILQNNWENLFDRINYL